MLCRAILHQKEIRFPKEAIYRIHSFGYSDNCSIVLALHLQIYIRPLDRERHNLVMIHQREGRNLPR